MISDRTIDESSAKYWCAFADKDFKSALDEVIKTVSDEKQQETAKAAVKSGIDGTLNEGFMDFFSKLQPTDPTGGSVGIVSDLAGKSEQEIKANAVAMASAAGLAATGLTPAGRSIAGGAGKTAAKHPAGTALTVTAAKLAADAAGDEDDSWWEKLEKLVNKVWDISKFTADHAAAITVACTTAYALFKTAPLWLPLTFRAVRAILRGNSLALVEFDSNGEWYRMHYDIKYRRWELVKKGFSLGGPVPEETDQLMNTEFFRAFLEQCREYIEPILKDGNREAVMKAIAALTDKKTKNVLDMILKDRTVVDNMFAMKFRY